MMLMQAAATVEVRRASSPANGVITHAASKAHHLRKVAVARGSSLPPIPEHQAQDPKVLGRSPANR